MDNPESVLQLLVSKKKKIATGIECPLVNDILVPSWCPIVVEFSLTMT